MNARLIVTKLLLIGLLPLLLFSHHTYREGHLTDTLLGCLGLTLLIVAAAGRTWASLYVSGRKDRELVTQGPYSLVRHPLYLFSLIGFLGAGFAFGSITLALLMGGIFAVGHWPTIRQEERRLAGLFGDAYARYHREVPRMIPRLGAVQKPAAISVNTAAFSRSLREASLIPMVFVAAHALEWAKLSEILPVVVILP